MGTIETETVAEFRLAILDLQRSEAARLNVRPSEETLPSSVFRRRILDVAATSPDGQCVVLIDEYDKPILRHLARPDITAFRDELKPFYGVVYDTGATRAALLGLEPPFCWIGRPFDEAFAPIPEK